MTTGPRNKKSEALGEPNDANKAGCIDFNLARNGKFNATVAIAAKA